jgi:hypothetical protein
MLEGRRVHQISRLPSSLGGGLLEQVHTVHRLIKWLPAGPLPGGSVRRKDLVQFIAREGGTRTVNADDLIVL